MLRSAEKEKMNGINDIAHHRAKLVYLLQNKLAYSKWLPISYTILQASSWTIGGTFAMLLLWGGRMKPNTSTDLAFILISWLCVASALLPAWAVYRIAGYHGLYTQLIINLGPTLMGLIFALSSRREEEYGLFLILIGIVFLGPFLSTATYLLGVRLYERVRESPNQAL